MLMTQIVMDPKYQNLPGIAYDQPDVYETGDSTENNQNDEISEDENECIEKMNISVSDSFKKFKGKQVSGNVDFSDRISRKIRTGYKCGEWELAENGSVETPQEKYHRLRCETTELLEQLLTLQDKENEDEKAKLKEMASQMSSTKQILDELNFDETSNSDPQAEKLRKLLNQSGNVTKDGNTEKLSTVIKLRPDSVYLAQTTRVAQLEHKLHKLESIVGNASHNLDRVIGTFPEGCNGLINVVNLLTAKTAALQPDQLENAEQRVSRLLPAMDTLKAASSADPERDAKINELYDLVKKSESVPHYQILERMQALEDLHKQANDFSKSMTELQALQSTITSGIQNNKTLLQGVQEVFAHNFDLIQKEIKKLDDRVSALTKK